MLFTDLPLCDSLLEGLEAMNFKETTPVQEQAIPVLLEKKDVIACAQTGTGKTAAFLLPLLNNLQNDDHEENKVKAIIMAPTRELAQQIDQMMEGFSYYTPFSSVAVYGGNDGEAWDVQRRGLQMGADVVISTPGRLLSHINLYNIDFSGVKYFILDEADRMLDMGFHEDIMKIEKLLPKDRQTVMFSATMPPKIKQLAKTIQQNPQEITIAVSKPPETILQSAYICHESQKIGIVKQLFKDKKPNKVILFSGSKMKVKEIAKTLHQMGLSVGEMHSDLDQTQRNHVMHEFRNERVDILVATDIVARGIDIDDISLVINFDVPYDAEDYVHRIGRTARAGDSGMAITFVGPDEQYRFSLIEKFLDKQLYRIPVPAELGEAPEYNPVRDQRGRGAARSSKASNRQRRPKQEEGTPGKTVKSESAERPKRAKPKKKRNPQPQGVNTATGSDKRQGKRSDQSGGKPRGERKDSGEQGGRPEPRKRRDQQPKRNQPLRKEQEGRNRVEKPTAEGEQGTRGPENRDRKRPPRDRQRNQSRNTERNQDRPQVHANDKNQEKKRKKQVHKPERAKPVDVSPTQTENTEKPKKKWSWWPFGKK